MLELTNNQKEVIVYLYRWFFEQDPDNASYITLGGYAGTGKTTLIALLRKALHNKNKELKVAFCSYTGKGTNVLKSKLNEQTVIYKQDKVSTIHSLIYTPIESAEGVIVGWEKKEELKADLIIIDEASMVDQMIWADIRSFNIPVIAVGDHGQLPPIAGKFNLMNEPKLVLKEIHRQAKENPIIKLSVHARETGIIQPGTYSSNVHKVILDNMDANEYMYDQLSQYNDETLVLCGLNSTRIKINNYVRTSLGFETEEPQINDKVICLRNNHKKRIFNGMTGKILSIYENDPEWYQATIDMDLGGIYEGLIYKGQFNSTEPLNFTKDRTKSVKGDLFDFGYALTVHKAQGSESEKVLLFEERFSKIDEAEWRQWLYTAITRARSQLIIFGPALPQEQEAEN